MALAGLASGVVRLSAWWGTDSPLAEVGVDSSMLLGNDDDVRLVVADVTEAGLWPEEVFIDVGVLTSDLSKKQKKYTFSLSLTNASCNYSNSLYDIIVMIFIHHNGFKQV